MSAPAIWADAQIEPERLQIQTEIDLNLRENAFLFSFCEFASLSSLCGEGCADHPLNEFLAQLRLNGGAQSGSPRTLAHRRRIEQPVT